MAASQNQMLLADHHRVYVVNASGDNLSVIGQTQLIGEIIRSVHIGDGVAALMTESSWHVIDINEPTNPVIVTTAASAVDGLFGPIEGQFMYGSSTEGVAITDLSDPHHPKQLGAIRLPGFPLPEYEPPGFILPHKGYVYIAARPGLMVVDATSPSQLKVTQQIPLTPTVRSMATEDDRLYVITHELGYTPSLHIFDISDPDHIVELGGYSDPRPCVAERRGSCSIAPAWASTSILALAGYVYLLAPGDGLYVLDVGDPASVKFVDFIQGDMGTSLFDTGGVLFVQGRSVLAFDLSEPGHPRALRNAALGDIWWLKDILKDGDSLFALSDIGLLVFDVSSPADPKLVGRFVQPLSVEESFGRLTKIGGLLAVPRPSQVQIFDVSDRSSPRLVSTIAGTGRFVRNVAALDGRLLIPRGDLGLGVYDLGDPTHPVELKTIRVPHRVTAITAKDNSVFVAGLATGTDGKDRHLTTVRLTQDLESTIRNQLTYRESVLSGDTTVELLRRANRLYFYRAYQETEVLDAVILDISRSENPLLIGARKIYGSVWVQGQVGDLFWFTFSMCPVSGACPVGSYSILDANSPTDPAQFRPFSGTRVGEISDQIDQSGFVYSAADGLHISQILALAETPGPLPTPFPTARFPQFVISIPTRAPTIEPSPTLASTPVPQATETPIALPTRIPHSTATTISSANRVYLPWTTTLP